MDVLEPDEETEMRDSVGELSPPALCPPEVIEALMEAKQADPSKFASWWEMDEQDVDEATEEQIQNDPVLRTLWAAENNKVDILQEQLAVDADLAKVKDTDGYTPLHRAAYGNHIEAMQVLLEAGADVNAGTQDGWTPLHSACRWDQTDAADLLLCRSCDVNALTSGGQTPLHLAAANTSATSRTLQLLLSNRYVDAGLRNGMGETALAVCERSNPYACLFEMAAPHITLLRPAAK